MHRAECVYRPYHGLSAAASAASVQVQHNDSGTYDEAGRFYPQRFEEIFTKFDKQRKGGLNLKDMVSLVWAHTTLWDPMGA